MGSRHLEVRISPRGARSGRCRPRRRPRSRRRRRWSTTRSWRVVPAASSSTGSLTSGWRSCWPRSATTARAWERLRRRATADALLRAVPPLGRGEPEDAHADASLPRTRRLVTRTVKPTVPVTVTYALTDLGSSLQTSCAASRCGRSAHGRGARQPGDVRQCVIDAVTATVTRSSGRGVPSCHVYLSMRRRRDGRMYADRPDAELRAGFLNLLVRGSPAGLSVFAGTVFASFDGALHAYRLPVTGS